MSSVPLGISTLLSHPGILYYNIQLSLIIIIIIIIIELLSHNFSLLRARNEHFKLYCYTEAIPTKEILQPRNSVQCL